MLTFLWVIYIAAMVAWLLPPFKQWKTKYFLYFLLLGLADPVCLLLTNVSEINNWHFHSVSSSLLIVSMINREKIRKNIYWIVLVLITIVYLVSVLNYSSLHSMVVINLLIISILFAKDFVVNTRETEKVNIFYLIVILYVLSGIMKTLFRLSHGETGYLYFFLTNFFQIFIAIYFTLYNVNNSKKFVLKARDIPHEYK